MWRAAGWPDFKLNMTRGGKTGQSGPVCGPSNRNEPKITICPV